MFSIFSVTVASLESSFLVDNVLRTTMCRGKLSSVADEIKRTPKTSIWVVLWMTLL